MTRAMFLASRVSYWSSKTFVIETWRMIDSQMNPGELKEKVAKLGRAGLLAYGLFNAITYTTFFFIAFLAFEKTGQNPANNLKACLGVSSAQNCFSLTTLLFGVRSWLKLEMWLWMAGDGVNVDRQQFHEAVASGGRGGVGSVHGQSDEENAEALQSSGWSLHVYVPRDCIVCFLRCRCGASHSLSSGQMTQTHAKLFAYMHFVGTLLHCRKVSPPLLLLLNFLSLAQCLHLIFSHWCQLKWMNMLVGTYKRFVLPWTEMICTSTCSFGDMLTCWKSMAGTLQCSEWSGRSMLQVFDSNL